MVRTRGFFSFNLAGNMGYLANFHSHIPKPIQNNQPMMRLANVRGSVHVTPEVGSENPIATRHIPVAERKPPTQSIRRTSSLRVYSGLV